MASFLLIFLSALIIAGAATPVAQRLAIYFGVVDKPNPRKVHLKPTPLLGGVAIYVGTIIALVFFGDRQEVTQLTGIVLGATVVSFCGLWDDQRPLGPGVKLLAQAAAALILYITGVNVSLFESPFLNFALTVLWVIGITNALNLLDNMDGLSGGVSAIAALFFLVLAMMSKQILVGGLAAALLGACLGFLWYNFNPARIFMGDSGSLFIGFMLAALGIKLRFTDHLTIITWMIPLMVLGVPIFDSTLVLISRLRRGKNPLTTPGKDHLSHRLVLRGFSHREAVLSIYVLCSVFGVMGILLTQIFTPIEAYTLSGAVAVIALCALIWLERLYVRMSQ
jgi:UDP-GlcNAc:undecaprenyl-phosphate GlcNAc-1-phosphate transferase